jgi:molybdopterin converting factor subunit 1
MPQVTILYFATVGERLGLERESCELPAQVTASEILAAIATRHPPVADLLNACRVAVDCEFVASRMHLRGGEELAVLPPMSGG